MQLAFRSHSRRPWRHWRQEGYIAWSLIVTFFLKIATVSFLLNWISWRGRNTRNSADFSQSVFWVWVQVLHNGQNQVDWSSVCRCSFWLLRGTIRVYDYPGIPLLVKYFRSQLSSKDSPKKQWWLILPYSSMWYLKERSKQLLWKLIPLRTPDVSPSIKPLQGWTSWFRFESSRGPELDFSVWQWTQFSLFCYWFSQLGAVLEHVCDFIASNGWISNNDIFALGQRANDK